MRHRPECCYFGAVQGRDGKAASDPLKCFGCGQCFTYYPTGAAAAVSKPDYELLYCSKDLLSLTRD